MLHATLVVGEARGMRSRSAIGVVLSDKDGHKQANRSNREGYTTAYGGNGSC